MPHAVRCWQQDLPAWLTGRRRANVLAFFLAAAALRLLYFRVTGVADASDAVTYDSVALRWASAGFSLRDAANLFQDFLNFRVTYAAVLALVYSAFGVGNHAAVVVVQALLDSAVAAALFYVGVRYRAPRAGAIAALIYVVLWENFQWTTYILADTVFVFALTLLLLAALAVAESPRWPAVATLGAASFLALITRPTAIILVLALPAYLLVRFRNQPRQAAVIAGVLALSLTATLGPTIAFWRTLGPTMNHASGEVRSRRSVNELLIASTREVQQNLIPAPVQHSETDFLTYLWRYPTAYPRLAAAKAVALFNPWSPQYSTKHLALNIVMLVPLYVLAIYAVARQRQSFVVAIAAVFVGSIALLHMVTWVDYDQRHRAALMPFVVLLAGYGLVTIGDALATRVSSPSVELALKP